MSPVKGSGSVGVTGNVSSVKPQGTVPSGKFEKILGAKTAEAKASGETAQQVAPTAEEVKERLRALVEGGASPDEVVQTVLEGHPLVNRFPQLKEPSVRKMIATVLSPMFQEKSLKRL